MVVAMTILFILFLIFLRALAFLFVLTAIGIFFTVAFFIMLVKTIFNIRADNRETSETRQSSSRTSQAQFSNRR